MTMLATLFREQMNKSKNVANKTEMTYSVSYPTGLLPLDLATGYIQTVNGEQRFELGISDGSINTLIGASSTGKTTLLVAMACSIIRPFRTSSIFFEQAEVGTNIQRIKNLSGITEENGFTDRFIVRDAGITIESIYDRVKAIYDIKTGNPGAYQYDTGMTDMKGQKVYKYEPTVVIIDSIKMITSQSKMYKGIGAYEKADDAGNDNVTNMDGAQEAGAVAIYLKKMVPLCRLANIIMILVNHITIKIPKNSRVPEKSEFPFLKQGEHLGSAGLLNYISNIMIRLDNLTKLIPGKDSNPYGIDGSIVQVDIVKNRTNKSGKAKCNLIFDQSTGFDNEYSMFQLLKENEIFEGAGAYLRLPGYPDMKFSAKNFKQKLHSDPEFAQAFNMTCFNFIRTELVNEYNRIQEQLRMSAGANSIYTSVLSQFGISGTPVYADDEGPTKTIKKKKSETTSIVEAVELTTPDSQEAEDEEEYYNIED